MDCITYLSRFFLQIFNQQNITLPLIASFKNPLGMSLGQSQLQLFKMKGYCTFKITKLFLRAQTLMDLLL